MEPRLDYSLDHEQIDGSITFDTDDYIIEARWRSEPTDRRAAAAFADQVAEKGKNALGLFVSVNGFTPGVKARFGRGTPFLAIDGEDLMCVLENRIGLEELLRRRKRHANETGSCYLPASAML